MLPKPGLELGPTVVRWTPAELVRAESLPMGTEVTLLAEVPSERCRPIQSSLRPSRNAGLKKKRSLQISSNYLTMTDVLITYSLGGVNAANLPKAPPH